MIEYECGHTSKGLLVLDGTPTMMIAVEKWNKTDKKMCFHCFYDSLHRTVKEVKEE